MNEEIFVSYASADRARVQALVVALQQQGWSIWWDREILAGESFEQVIEDALTQSRCVVVVWSKHSVQSRWVRAEAEEAAQRGILVPVLLDDIQLPLAYRQIQASRLVEWGEDPDYPEFRKFQAAVARSVAKTRSGGEKAQTSVQASLPISAAASSTGSRLNLVERLLRLRDLSPLFVLLGGMIAGIVLVAASLLVGVGFFPAEMTAASGQRYAKEVGFVWALNWSVIYVVAFPTIIFLMIVSFQNIDSTLRRLVRTGMVVGQGWKPVSEDMLIRDWRLALARSLPWAGALCALVAVQSLTEWYFMSGSHLAAGAFSPEFDEYDWSVAALLQGGSRHVSPAVNGAFSLVAYVVQGVSAAIVLCFFAFIFAFSNMVYRYARQSTVVRLIPAIDSEDNRCGFSVFESFFKNALYVAMMVFVILYLMQVQNLYLRSEAPNLALFLLGGIGDALHVSVSGQLEQGLDILAGTLFSIGDSSNLTSTAAIFLGVVLVMVILLGPAYVLNFAARQSRNEIRSYIEANGTGTLSKLTAAECLQRLDRMEFWPVKWPRINHMVGFLVFAFLCLLFYRLGLLFLLGSALVAATAGPSGRALPTCAWQAGTC